MRTRSKRGSCLYPRSPRVARLVMRAVRHVSPIGRRCGRRPPPLLEVGRQNAGTGTGNSSVLTYPGRLGRILAPSQLEWRDGVVAPGVGHLDVAASGRRQRRQHLSSAEATGRLFEACGDDPVIDEVARMLSLLDDDLVVVLLTARPMRVQRQTLEWAQRHGLRWDLLVMRSEGDRDWASEYKRRVVGDLRAAGYEPQLAVEDDRRNVDMFHRAGIPCSTSTALYTEEVVVKAHRSLTTLSEWPVPFPHHEEQPQDHGLIAGIGGLMILVGSMFGRGGASLGLAIGWCSSGLYWFSDKFAIRAARAVEVSEAQMPQYQAIVRDLCERIDMPMPPVPSRPTPSPTRSHGRTRTTRRLREPGNPGRPHAGRAARAPRHEISHVETAKHHHPRSPRPSHGHHVHGPDGDVGSHVHRWGGATARTAAASSAAPWRFWRHRGSYAPDGLSRSREYEPTAAGRGCWATVSSSPGPGEDRPRHTASIPSQVEPGNASPKSPTPSPVEDPVQDLGRPPADGGPHRPPRGATGGRRRAEEG